jgi:hypothetical protein
VWGEPHHSFDFLSLISDIEQFFKCCWYFYQQYFFGNMSFQVLWGFLFVCFGGDLNSGLCAFYTGALPLEPYPHPFLFWLFLRQDLIFCPGQPRPWSHVTLLTITGMTRMYIMTIQWLRWSCHQHFPRAGSNCDPRDSASQIARSKGISHQHPAPVNGSFGFSGCCHHLCS